MSLLRKLGVASIFVVLSACGQTKTSAPHLPLDLSSAEYRERLLSLSSESALFDEGRIEALALGISEDELQGVRDALAMGERSLKWIDHMNSFRDEASKLRLTTRAGGLRGIPIEAPSRYSPAIISTRLTENLALLDATTRSVLVDGKDFTQNPGIPDEAFVVIAKKIDGAYQTAARWQLISPWLSYYEEASRRDVRGYHSLSRDPETTNKLASFDSLEKSAQDSIAAALVTLCRNSGQSLSSCNGAVEGARLNRSLVGLYERFLPQGRRNWDSFFDIGNARGDIRWNAQEEHSAHLPFRRHAEDRFTDFVKSNVEDEFSWKGFRLILDLQAADAPASLPHVIFEPGATPHVNGLGGNQIVMDANAPLTEWDVQWTIRHEFGHVLGLPDCYVEFFDPAAREMVNYQLDVTDLMCSRAGRMNERIYDELRQAYFR
jgi:hypothetical protein